MIASSQQFLDSLAETNLQKLVLPDEKILKQALK